LRDETDRLHTNNVRLRAIGGIDALPKEVRNELLDAIRKTKDNTGLTLTLALNYSGRWDLTEAIRQIVRDVQEARLTSPEITEERIASYLSTHDTPDPDLLIRTSGEFRISNFLLWQLAYTEIYITSKCWPAFRRDELYAAVRDYQRRERRFGMVSEQVHDGKKGRSQFGRLLRRVAGS
jgi:undecaprenyl diphosphate synthase